MAYPNGCLYRTITRVGMRNIWARLVISDNEKLQGSNSSSYGVTIGARPIAFVRSDMIYSVAETAEHLVVIRVDCEETECIHDLMDTLGLPWGQYTSCRGR